MRVGVDRECRLPDVFRGLQRGTDAHAGVGEEQVDLAEPLVGGFDEGDVARLAADVGTDPVGAAGPDVVQRLGGAFGACLVEVGRHHVGARPVEALGEGSADAAGSAGHHHMSSGEIHAGDGKRHRSGNTVFTVRCVSPVVPDGYGHV
jgi:hypothetical protein